MEEWIRMRGELSVMGRSFRHQRLDELREACIRFNLSEISGIRTRAHNANEKGHASSKHQGGFAYDLHADDPAVLNRAARWFEQKGWPRPVVKSHGLHVQMFPVGPVPTGVFA